MSRRAYLFLVLVRLYFALSPSYLHPDENFQGPEVIAGKLFLRPPIPWLELRGLEYVVWHAPINHVGGALREKPRRRAPRSAIELAASTLDHLLIFYISAGQIFSYPVKLTWEFTSDGPIRSVFPLWPVYGLPMLLLKWLWIGNGNDGDIPPIAVFWTLRVLMFTLSFVLEDWALHELIESPRHRRVAVLLVASSYVTWTYQTHTFSNSIETLAVAWSLVLIQRIVENKVRALFEWS
jgi:hypothetical protein